MQAVADDEDVARAVLARRDADEPAFPPLATWTSELDALARIEDRLGNLIAAVIASAGNRPPRVTPALRPRTAFDRVRLEVRMTTHRYLVSRLLPDQQDT